MAIVANPYFLYPFGQSTSSYAPVSNTGGVTGTMSYQYGFTVNYEQDLQTVATALPIPRNQMNQLFFDITSALQIIQLNGFPMWVASGSGGPASYPINATIRYSDDIIYQSAVASNTSTPGTNTDWTAISGDLNSVPVGTMIDYAGTRVLPTGYLKTDGTALSRSTYLKLFNAIVDLQTCATHTNTTLTVIDSTDMYVGMAIEGDSTIPAGTTVASVTNTTTIVMSQAATGSNASEQVRFFNWGAGDGSTTFNAPDTRDRVLLGSNGQNAGSVDATSTCVGQTGGASTVTLGIANMPAGVPVTTEVTGIQGDAVGAGAAGSAPAVTLIDPGTWAPGAGVATNIVQRSGVCKKLIKYL